MLDVVMPVQLGRFISDEVIGALGSQGVPYRLFVSTTVQFKVAEARNDVKLMASSEYVLMLDNDLVLPDGGIVRMIDVLDRFSDFMAIALPRRDFQDEGDYVDLGGVSISEPGHVGMSCVLWRLKYLESLEFVVDNKCECQNACDELRSKGFRIGFLPSPCDHVDSVTEILKHDIVVHDELMAAADESSSAFMKAMRANGMITDEEWERVSR